ncbi:MAG TPA: helix-turn-helix domain-containing protein [Gaiella sp.]|jgi:DNA-binding transcriptional ArsR family regulator
MERQIELSDPAALRALAHPVRLRLVSLLRREGALTASEAGRRLGESSGSTSYHLRQLERFGLVEEAGTGRGRERPWRATSLYTSWPSVPESEDLAEASLVLDRIVVNRYAERLGEWIEHRGAEPKEWVEAASFGDSLLYLDREELASLGDALRALAEPYLDRISDPTRRPAGARPVAFVQIAFPVDEP